MEAQTKATGRVHRVKATLIATSRAVLVGKAAESIDILWRGGWCILEQSPGAVRGLTFKDASSHRPNSRPVFRRFGRTRETAKAQHMNPPISPARHAQRHAERYRTCPSSMYANRTREGQEC